MKAAAFHSDERHRRARSPRAAASALLTENRWLDGALTDLC
ncbi:hypothetical protein [Salinispora oceanensis]|nr:hypothetical protein [Salinispora oceanensis]